jgi:hypothetical protein
MTDFDRNHEAKSEKARRETRERKSYAGPTLEKHGQLARLAAGTATSAPAIL